MAKQYTSPSGVVVNEPGGASRQYQTTAGVVQTENDVPSTPAIYPPSVAAGAVTITGAHILGGFAFTVPIASTSVAGTASGATTPAIDTTGANIIYIVAGWNDTTTTNPTFSDSKGNTYSLAVNRTASTTGPSVNYEMRLMVCFNPIVGPGHTFSIAGTDIYPSLSVQAWRGASGPSTFSGMSGSSSGATINLTTVDTGLLGGGINPPMAVGELMVVGMFHLDNGGATVTLDPARPGFTATSQIPWSATNMGGGMAYKVVTSAGNDFARWLLTNLTLRAMGVGVSWLSALAVTPPTITAGAVTIGGAHIAAGGTFPPTLTALLAGATITSGSGLFPPTLLVHQSVTTAHRATTATTFLPSVALAAIQNVTTQPITGGAVTAPSVTTGPVTVTTATITTTAAVNIPIVSLAGVTNVSLVPFASTLSMNVPTLAAGPVAVTAGTRTTTIQVFAPTVAFVTVGATIASGNQRFTPMVASTLTLATISATSQVFLPIVAAAGSTAIGLTFTASTTVVRVPTVSAGPVSVTTGTRTTSIQVFVPTVAPGPALVTSGTRPAANQRFAPTIGVGPVSVTGATIATTGVRYPPTVTALAAGSIGAPNIPTGSQVNAPTIVGGLAIIFPPVITATLVVRVPTVTTGPVSITNVGNRPSTLQVFIPSVVPGVVTVLGTTIVSTAQVHALSVTLNITTAAIAATGLLFLPTVFVAGEDLSIGGATVTSTELLNPPSVALAGTGPISPFDVVESCGVRVQQLVLASAIDCTQLMMSKYVKVEGVQQLVAAISCTQLVTSKCVKVERLTSSTVKGSYQ